MTDEIRSEGGLCAPLYLPLPELANMSALKDALPTFSAMRGMEDTRTDKQRRKQAKKEARERKRRAKPITVTLTVGEWEDMQNGIYW